MRTKSTQIKVLQTLAALLLVSLAGSCASMKSCFGANTNEDLRKPIHNPFGDYYTSPRSDPNQMITLRTKKGDRSIEVELPGRAAEMSDFEIPVAPAFREPGGAKTRNIASISGGEGVSTDNGDSAQQGAALTDDRYMEKAISPADREILNSLPTARPQDEAKRRDIEQGLGLMPSDDQEPPAGAKSYLAALDHIKQLYRSGRYEAGLLETDDTIRLYPTDPKLHSMRGTLLDRLGKEDLALKSWNQAVRFDPSNQNLRRFVERKQQKRSVAGK